MPPQCKDKPMPKETMPKRKSIVEKKMSKVGEEFKAGKLHSGSKKGPIVKSRDQMVAIGLSESRKAGAKIPRKGKK